MDDGLYDLLSARAKIAMNALTGLTLIALCHFYSLSQGPMYWMAGWITDSDGEFYVELAFIFSFIPICMAEWLIVYALDRCVARLRRPAKALSLSLGNN
jgi:TRAP-type C4-dicarboxylate transport system permease small subunit